jgi:hypothetical protein
MDHSPLWTRFLQALFRHLSSCGSPVANRVLATARSLLERRLRDVSHAVSLPSAAAATAGGDDAQAAAALCAASLAAATADASALVVYRALWCNMHVALHAAANGSSVAERIVGRVLPALLASSSSSSSETDWLVDAVIAAVSAVHAHGVVGAVDAVAQWYSSEVSVKQPKRKPRLRVAVATMLRRLSEHSSFAASISSAPSVHRLCVV